MIFLCNNGNNQNNSVSAKSFMSIPNDLTMFTFKLNWKQYVTGNNCTYLSSTLITVETEFGSGTGVTDGISLGMLDITRSQIAILSFISLLLFITLCPQKWLKTGKSDTIQVYTIILYINICETCKQNKKCPHSIV